MSATRRISIVIPAYNQRRFIGEALHSVFAQERLPDEVIVIDDGSTDGTAEFVQGAFAKAIVKQQRNQGLPAAREAGSQAATGELLLFLDSDDLLRPQALRLLEQALAADAAAPAAVGEALLFGEPENVQARQAVKIESGGNQLAMLCRRNFIQTAGCVLIRHAALQSVGGWDTRLGGVADWDMWLRLAMLAPLAMVAEPVLDYRVHPASMSSDRAAMLCAEYLFAERHASRGSGLEKWPEVVRELEAKQKYLADRILGMAFRRWCRGKFPGRSLLGMAMVRMRARLGGSRMASGLRSSMRFCRRG